MTTTNCDEWFQAAPDKQKPVLDALRAMILAAAPGVIEEFKWSRPYYSTAHGSFGYLHYTKNHVTLGFTKGTSLSDPKKLLEGTGKDMRHIKILSADAMNRPALLQLIKQAVKLA